MNPYEESWHFLQSTIAAILRITKDPRVEQLVADCDQAVEEVFESCGEVLPFPKEAQKKSLRDGNLESDA